MATRLIRVRPAAVFWRTAAAIFVVRQLLLLGAVVRLFPPRLRVWAFLFGRWGTRASIFWALVGGALAVLLAQLFVKLVVGPALRSWLSPRADGSEAHFHLDPGERVLRAAPARRRQGRTWRPGTLVMTDRRVWFITPDWDASPWSVPLGGSVRARRIPSPLAAWAMLEGVPDLVAVNEGAGGDPGQAETFAVGEPADLLGWFQAPAPALVTPNTDR